MNDNYDAVLLALSTFIVDNAPAGAEREVVRMRANLAEGRPTYIGFDFRPTDYISLDFRPTRDTGCQLYVRVESPEGKYDTKRIMDEEGNRWHAYVVKCEVSWASWGSASVETSQRRLAVMTEVTRFACEVERAFADVFYRLDQTVEQIRANEAYQAERRIIQTVTDAVKNNAKGMKVGQQKIVPVPGADFTSVCPIEVERHWDGRAFKYRATAVAKEGFVFTRVA
jgi:hypothetical protein